MTADSNEEKGQNGSFLQEFSERLYAEGTSEIYLSAPIWIKAIWISTFVLFYIYGGYQIYLVLYDYITDPIATDIIFENGLKLPNLAVSPSDVISPTKLRALNITLDQEIHLRAQLGSAGFNRIKLEQNLVFESLMGMEASRSSRELFHMLRRRLQKAHDALKVSKNNRSAMDGSRDKSYSWPKAQDFKKTLLDVTYKPIELLDIPPIGKKIKQYRSYGSGRLWYVILFNSSCPECNFFRYPPICFLRNTDNNMSFTDDEYHVTFFTDSGDLPALRYGQFHQITSTLKKMSRLKPCGKDGKENLQKFETCKNDYLQNNFECCDCGLHHSSCWANISACCTSAFVRVSGRAMQKRCWTARLKPCDEVIVSSVVTSRPIDDGTNWGRFRAMTTDGCFQIQFSDLHHSLVFREREKFEVYHFLSDIGGVASLLMGMSALTIPQAIYLCIVLGYRSSRKG